MTHSEDIKDISAAMSKAQGEMKPALKDATNPAYRSHYATLTAVWEACREPLSKHGIAVWQDACISELGVAVTTKLTHTSGQWIEFGPLAVPMSKQDAHGLGSALSYGKRYALSTAIGIVAEEDDDANAAVGTTEAHAARPPDGAMETVKVKVTGIVQRQLSSGGTKYTITASDRQTYSTLKKALAESAKAAQEAGSEIELTWKQTQYGRDVVGINELVEVPL